MITVTIVRGLDIEKLHIPYFTSIDRLRLLFHNKPGVAYVGQSSVGWVYDGKTIRMAKSIFDEKPRARR